MPDPSTSTSTPPTDTADATDAVWLDIPKKIGLQLDPDSAVPADFRRELPYGAEIHGVSFFAAQAVRGPLTLCIVLDGKTTGIEVTREFVLAAGDEAIFEFDAAMQVWAGVEEHTTVRDSAGETIQLRAVAGHVGQPYTKVLAVLEAPKP